MKPLYDMGADEVIPEEFETSVEIFTRVLTKYLIPKEEIERFIIEIRPDGYEMLRSVAQQPGLTCELLPVPGVEIVTVTVQERSRSAGKTLAELAIRRKHGINVLAISRGGVVDHGPRGDGFAA